ncbi:protein-tyrosine phosphatase-like protein [Geopyxis carbonaria]|nr:protein-tyrosine phosphatase-like protein [Geopyxis carbonaria]
MSSYTTSPRSSKAFESVSHGPHTQIRQSDPYPAVAQQSPTQTSAVMSTTTVPLSPAGDGEHQAPSPISSAGYFGFMADSTDSTHGQHSKKNWSPASSSIRSAAARSPLQVQVENPSTPFLKQAEVLAQKLHRPNSGRKVVGSVGEVPLSGHTSNPTEGIRKDAMKSAQVFASPGNDYFSSNRSQTSIATGPSEERSPQSGDPVFLSCDQLSELLQTHNKSNLLLLDVRTYKLFAESRISSAVNLCIPTTLLKRPSFNVSKLSETFANQRDKEIFGKWKAMEFIVVYDADSKDVHDSSGMTALHTLSKFSREGWRGKAYILKGGFSAFSQAFPDRVDGVAITNGSSGTKKLSLGVGPHATGGIGGVFNCPLPSQQSVVNPFFSNIRQNMDLIGGVGELPIHLPQTMGVENITQLPQWLREVVCDKQGPKIVADRFLKIEKAEQRRMQDALNVSVQYDSPMSTNIKPHTLAGVEKGTKNRYNNIWPYDHSRVKLQDYPQEECDYVNASHVKTKNGQKRYIASQAPLPTTFRDFWSMIWEQDVRVIVMLTAEEEGGRLKSHNYWRSNTYGSIRLNCIQERKVSLEPSLSKGGPKRRSVSTSSQPSMADSSMPFIIVRKFTLEHTTRPFSPIHEVTQLQYSSWPDLGAPAHPSHVLGLIEHTESVVRSALSSDTSSTRRPVLVHCSAGCGRTGTFCTIDSVISMIRRQISHRKRQSHEDGSSDGDGNMTMKKLGLDDDSDWINNDDQDLVFKAVSELRDQRLSMVQCLQQYVLCYETVLEWLAKQTPLDSGKRKA